MIDVIHLDPKEFQQAKQNAGCATILDGRQSIVLGIVVLQCDEDSYPVRIVEVRHTQAHNLSMKDLELLLMGHEIQSEEITFIVWRKI